METKITTTHADVIAELRGWGYLDSTTTTLPPARMIWPDADAQSVRMRRDFASLMRRFAYQPSQRITTYDTNNREWPMWEVNGAALLTAYDDWYQASGWKLEGR